MTAARRLFITSRSDGRGRGAPGAAAVGHSSLHGRRGELRRIDHGSKSARRCRSPRSTDESSGADMLYSSGTTGRPKGVKFALPSEPIDHPTTLVQLASKLYGLSADSVYLSPAPLYHAAPLRWCMTTQHLGGTVVMMDRFDPEQALALIERHRVTHAQWVPTHFVRLLKLDPEVRNRYDVSSLRSAIHAAAPCPVPIKQQMIDWWGPDPARVLRRHRGQRYDRDQRRRLAAQEGLRRPRGVRRDPDLRRRGRAARADARGHGVFRGRQAVRVSQRAGRRPRNRSNATAGARSATSATSTRTATSTSPTARRS